MPPFGASCLWSVAAGVRRGGSLGCAVRRWRRWPVLVAAGYTRKEPAAKPKLGLLLPMIDSMLKADRAAPAKQRHTAKRIFERLRDEHGFAGGVPLSVLYDNTKIAVAKICGDGKRERTRAFTELCSHYLFRDRLGRPSKGNDKGKRNDKGKVEGLVKFSRADFMVPNPQVTSFAALNAMLEERCRARQGD